MNYISVLESVRARLAGNSPKYVPPFPNLEHLTQRREAERTGPFKGGTTRVVPGAKSQSVAKLVFGNVTQEVPIFEFDTNGKYHTLDHPSLTYNILAVTPRYKEFVWSDHDYGGADVYQEELLHSKEPVLDVDGETIDVPVLMRTRPVEHPFDILVEIRAIASGPTEAAAAWLVQYVYERFPPRGYIRVPQMDGSYRSWDMLYVNFDDRDSRSYTIADEREYGKVWTYTVEGYLDNTDLTRLEQRSKSVTINTTRIGG